MNKEAELPKSIDFSQLPEALRAFKAGKDAREHAHIHTSMHTCADTHVCTHREAERERFKSERIMAPALKVSLKTQFGFSRFLPDKKGSFGTSKGFVLLFSPRDNDGRPRRDTVSQRRQKPPGARARRGRIWAKRKKKSVDKAFNGEV